MIRDSAGLIFPLVELSAREWVQFSVGRIVAYYAVGLVECITPSYNAEISPASTRGLLAGSMMTLTALGNLWGAGMSRAYVTELSNKGWIIPTAMQFIPAILLITLVPFTQESPRWLILKGRVEEAQRGLDRIRPAAEVDSGATQAEVKTLEQLVKESMEREQGTWWDLFKGNYLRRTWVSINVMQAEFLLTVKTDRFDALHPTADERQSIHPVLRPHLLRSTRSRRHVIHLRRDRSSNGRYRLWCRSGLARYCR